jgi:chemotaxis-related protein WspD
MIVIGNADDRWVFPVEEVLGVYRFEPEDVHPSPVVVAKASETYTQGVLNWQKNKVNFLDLELMSYTLTRKIMEVDQK